MKAFVTEALRRDHRRDSFVCGVAALDRYFSEFALQDVKRLVAGCFVAVAANGDIAGFYTLAATHVPLGALPPETVRKLPRYPVIPATHMGRLAVASHFQGHGLGRALVADAAIRTKGFGIGAFALIVDAKDERAVAFYQANAFALIAGETRRLFQPIASAVELMGH